MVELSLRIVKQLVSPFRECYSIVLMITVIDMVSKILKISKITLFFISSRRVPNMVVSKLLMMVMVMVMMVVVVIIAMMRR